MHSLASSDEGINAEFIALEDAITIRFSEKFDILGLKLENSIEKIHFAMDIIQSFSHEYVFDKHEYIDYFIMREMVTNTIINIFI